MIVKKYIAILFTTLYVVAMLRPIAPFVEYAINYDYISKVLCINQDKPEMSCKGKCHLMQELEKQQQEDKSALTIVLEEYPIGFVEILTIKKAANQLTENRDKIYGYQQNYTYLIVDAPFRPPTSFTA